MKTPANPAENIVGCGFVVGIVTTLATIVAGIICAVICGCVLMVRLAFQF